VSWEVYWSDEAEGELNRIVSIAPDPGLVAVASAQLEQNLATDPIELSESRTEDYRVIFSLPLVAYFVVHSQQQTIQVIHVRAACKRHQR
jgi:hypothetical protein